MDNLLELMDNYIKNEKTDLLEKVKEEIENIDPGYNFEGFYHCQNKALEIIEKRISEMKGEQE